MMIINRRHLTYKHDIIDSLADAKGYLRENSYGRWYGAYRQHGHICSCQIGQKVVRNGLHVSMLEYDIHDCGVSDNPNYC